MLVAGFVRLRLPLEYRLVAFLKHPGRPAPPGSLEQRTYDRADVYAITHRVVVLSLKRSESDARHPSAVVQLDFFGDRRAGHDSRPSSTSRSNVTSVRQQSTGEAPRPHNRVPTGLRCPVYVIVGVCNLQATVRFVINRRGWDKVQAMRLRCGFDCIRDERLTISMVGR